MENNNFLNYKVFLETVGYDSAEIEKYFHNVIGSLEKEASLLIDERDERVEKLYNDYSESLNLYDKVKYSILSKYFLDYSELNEEYAKKKINAETVFLNKTNVLRDKIETEKKIIERIKSDYLVKFYEKKKEPQRNINNIASEIDKEYLAHAKMILDARNKINDHREFYITAENHIRELDKLTDFLSEFSDYNSELFNGENINTEVETNKLVVYLSYINREFSEIVNIPFKSLYDSLYTAFDDIILDARERKNKLTEDLKSSKEKVSSSFKLVDKEYKEVKDYFDKKLSENIEDSLRKEIISDENSLLDSIESKKTRISLDYAIEANLISEEANILEDYVKELELANSSIKSSFDKEMEKTSDLIKSIIESVKGLVQDEIESINSFEKDSGDAREIVNYFNKRFKKLEIDSSLEFLYKYKKLISESTDKNKDLDCIAFEILTSEELLKIKLLDLRKTLLSLEDELKIKVIEYDNKIEEMKETSTPFIEIYNAEKSIELLKNDFESDKKLLDNELEYKIKVIDLKKNIDILRNDYMIAYTRLENVSRLIEKRSDIEPKIIDLKSSIKLEKVIEAVLLDSANKMNEYSYTMKEYDRSIEELDNETNSKIRYLNNVLEIEIKNFEEVKKSLYKNAEEMKAKVYPGLQDTKKKSGSKLKELRNKYNKKRNDFINDNKKKENKYNEIISSFEELISQFNANVSDYNIESGAIEEYKDYYYKEANELILKANELLNKNNLKETNAKADFSLNKLLLSNYKKESERITSSFLSKLSKEFHASMKKIVFYTGKDLEKKLKEIDDEYKNAIALIAINNTILETPSLDELKSIDDKTQEATKNHEKSISSYKKYYMSTLDSIKSDYDARLKELNALKDKCTYFFDNLNESINEEINKEYNKIKTDHDNDMTGVTVTEKELSRIALSKIDTMSDEIKGKNKDMERIEKEYKSINDLYFDSIKNESKESFNAIKGEMKKYEDDVNEYIEYRLNDRDNYIKSLRSASSVFLMDYKDMRSSIIDKYNEKKADNIVEYSRLLSSIKNNNSESYNELSFKTESFENELENLSKSLMEKTKEINDKLSNDSTEKIKNFGENINKIAK